MGDITLQSAHQFSNLGLAGHLVGAISYARSRLAEVDAAVLHRSKTGDITTKKDLAVQNAVAEYFRVHQIPIVLNGEEGIVSSGDARYLVLADPLEGTQNAVNGLDHGVNLAIAPYKSTVRVKEIAAAAVANLRDNVIYAGNRGRDPVFKVEGDLVRELSFPPKKTDIYEAPLPWAYTTDVMQRARQIAIMEVLVHHLGNQPRSLDATGTRLVAMLNGDICAYADWRDATKCWDVLPSAFLLGKAGFVVTDTHGFTFDEAIFYDTSITQDHGLNRNIGMNFVATSPSKHESIIFDRMVSFFSMVAKERGNNSLGRWLGMVFQDGIDKRERLYGGLDHDNVRQVVGRVRKTFLESLPPTAKAPNLSEFDRLMSWMTNYNLCFN